MPHGSRNLPEPSGMDSASNNPGQSAPADRQQGRLPHEHQWLLPEEIDALAARRNRPTIPTNEDWRSDSGRAGGLTSSTPLPADPYYQHDQSHRSEVRGYGSYGDPPSRGFPPTVLPPNPYLSQDEGRQSEMQRYGPYGDPYYGGLQSTAPPPNLPSYQDQNRQGDISGARQHEPRGNRRPGGSPSRAPTVHPDSPQHNNRKAWNVFQDNELSEHIAAGKTWKEIADEMDRSTGSIETHWLLIRHRYAGIEYDPPVQSFQRRKKTWRSKEREEKKEKKKPRGRR